MNNNRKFITTIPVHRRIDAVYGILGEDNLICSIYRLPVIGIDVYMTLNTDSKDMWENDFMVPDSEGLITPIDRISPFIALEFDGIQENWSKEIKFYNERHEKLLKLTVKVK